MRTLRVMCRNQTAAPRTASLARLVLACLLALPITGCASSATPDADTAPAAPLELDVSAASSLRKVLVATAPDFEQAHNVKLVFNFGATGQLARQIEGGAPADVFLSASPSTVATLASQQFVSGEASETFAGNTLVILVPRGNPAHIEAPADLFKAKSLTTGDPAVAPHGQKAVEWLTNVGLWTRLSPKFVFAANASQTDDYIARGEVDAGIGFASDAIARSDIETAYSVPDSEVRPVRYVAAPVTVSAHPDLARAYITYLLTDPAQRALLSYGFKPRPAE